MASRSGIILRNTLFNAVGRFWSFLVALFLTPYIVGHVGAERYGVWSIVGIFTGYFGLLDFGIKSSFAKYIAEFHAKNDRDRLHQVVNTGLAFYSLFALFLATLAFLLVGPLAAFLAIPENIRDESVFVIMLGMVLFGIGNALSVFGAVQTGLQRMDISNNVAIALSIPNIVGTVFFLEHGYGLPGLMVNNALVLILGSGVNLAVAFRLLPGLRLQLLGASREMLGTLFRYGYKLQVSFFANLVSFHTDKLLISYFLGVGLVTPYQLGTAMLQAARQACLILISALVPAASEMETAGGKEALRELFLRGSKYLVLASTPLTFFVAADAPALLRAWMGPGYDAAIPVVRILAAGYFAATVTGVASAITAGVARTQFDMKFGLLLAGLNLSLGIILIVRLGFMGVVLASAASLFAASLFYMRMFLGWLGSSWGSYLRLFLRPAAAGAVATAAILALDQLLWPGGAPGDRLGNLRLLAGHGLLFAGCYVVFIALSGHLDEYDRKLILGWIPSSRTL